MHVDREADVVIAIVTYNSAAVVESLLDSLPRALGGLASETIVVDNGSSDGTLAALSRRDDIRVVAARNNGYAAGINRGVAEATSAAPILVLNPDVVLAPLAVPRLLGALGPGVGVVGPRLVDVGDRLTCSIGREPTFARALGLGRTGLPALSERRTRAADYERHQRADWLVGAVLLVARECHNDLDGWDESFFLYSEETDFCLRARDRGWTVAYEPSATAAHIGGQSGRNGRTEAMQVLNRVRLYGRRHGVAATSCYFVATIAVQASRVVRGRPASGTALRALLTPRARPSELGLTGGLLPR